MLSLQRAVPRQRLQRRAEQRRRGHVPERVYEHGGHGTRQRPATGRDGPQHHGVDGRLRDERGGFAEEKKNQKHRKRRRQKRQLQQDKPHRAGHRAHAQRVAHRVAQFIHRDSPDRGSPRAGDDGD